jgi:hypothetical protein
MRTRDLSDNTINNIAVRAINTFSDESVILSGDFSTQQIVFYNAADVSMGQLTIPVRKTSGVINRDIFMAAFNTSGVLRYYNYIRSTNISSAINELNSSIAIDSANNAYLAGTILNASTPNLIQIFNKNTSSTTPSANIVYDTSGFSFGGDPNNNCNFQTNNVFITKYDYNGDFKWFAPIGNQLDLSGDVSYQIKATNTGVVISMLYNGTMSSSPAGIRTMSIYDGQTIAQKNTPGNVFRRVDLSGTSLSNNIIIKYAFDGSGSWVKQIQGDVYLGGPITASSITNIGTALPITIDSSSNIYTVSSYQGSASFPTVSIFDITNSTGSRNKISAPTDVEPSSGSNPYIISFLDDGTLRWYAIMKGRGAGSGTFPFNSLTTSTNELLVLCQQQSINDLAIYNSSGAISTRTIDISNAGQPHLAVYKIQSNGTIPGTTIKYIISRPTQITSAFNVRVNNGISVDSSNNVYITAELDSVSPAIGQTLDLINQDGATVATITKRSSNRYEYFTVKIPASFTQE